ncbi:MAG: DUF2304 domain-containing protein [Phycisphaerales bacterium]|nr:DUF2304 domain-containing protein [Phycisphaerae bacterium]NNF44170.1 DUF2304 domain-containing protein [Phycisphaerales bacterium]NNM25958.1 DUF2304 domain-containing protein [Phycisphaerales bacterium]
MSTFQIILLAALAAIFVFAIVLNRLRRTSFRTMFIVTVIWAVGSVATAWPDLTTLVARAVGIGRGADLLLYSAVVIMFVGFFMVYLRLVRLRRNITTLVRQAALHQAEGPLDSGTRDLKATGEGV